MSATLMSTDVGELEKQRIGYIGVSLSEWTSNLEPQYTAGSSFECAGSVYYCTALEDCGTNAEWAAIANSTLVYSYFNVSTLVFYWSSTAPAWDTAKHGWYHGVSTTHRCLCQSYKNASGEYTQKSILNDREYKRRYFTNVLSGDTTENEIYDAFDAILPNIGDLILISGGIFNGASIDAVFNRAFRFDANTIRLYGGAGAGLYNWDCQNGSTVSHIISIAWINQ